MKLQSVQPYNMKSIQASGARPQGGLNHTMPAIKFAGSGSDGGGFFAGIKRFFGTLGSIFNFNSKKFEMANAEAVLETQLDQLRGKIKKAKDARTSIEARAIVAKDKYDEMKKIEVKEEAEARRAAELAGKEQDETRKNRLLQLARQEAVEWKAAKEAAAAAFAELQELDLEAQRARAEFDQFQRDAQQLQKQIEKGKDSIRMTKVRNEMAGLREDLKTVTGGVATSKTAEMLEKIKFEEAKAKAALNDGASTAEILEHAELAKLKEEAEADAALAELLGTTSEKPAEVTKTQQAATGGSLDDLDKQTA